ncbi:MAG: hypothetical protein BMS9Abin23_0084 [Thermodesulfobacteriota bacterium]|nr:MAG: hypothetical protein BMS9Abin23_0084 [Thermodesulfobacteriota bacterium]
MGKAKAAAEKAGGLDLGLGLGRVASTGVGTVADAEADAAEAGGLLTLMSY